VDDNAITVWHRSEQTYRLLGRRVECDEVYVIAGHKGQPEVVKKGRTGRRRRLKSKSGTRNAGKEKPRFSRGIQPRGRSSSQDASQRKASHDAPLLKASIVPGTLSILTNTSSILLYPSGV